MRKILSIAAAIAVTVALTSCASTRIPDAQKLALYRSHAGQPLSGFRLTMGGVQWTALGDSALAVWTAPQRAYLLELGHSCPELDFATTISLSDSLGHVSAGFDRVTPMAPGSMRMSCRIREIRPLDTRALKVAERELLQAARAPRE